MKKIILLMCGLLLLTGCGSKKEDVVIIKPVEEAEEQTNDLSEDEFWENLENGTYSDEDAQPSPAVIRENGNLPESYDDLSEEESAYYRGIVVQAYLSLDIEMIRSFSADPDNDQNIQRLEKIANDEESRNYWKETIGTAIYYPNSDIFLYKSADYAFAKWWTACKEKGIEIGDFEDMPDELRESLWKEYQKAPYEMSSVLFDDYGMEIEDGYWNVNYTIIKDLYDGIDDAISSIYYNDHLDPLELLFDCPSTSLGYDYIEDEVAFYEEYKNKDFNSIFDKIEKRDGSFFEAWKKYHDDPDLKKKLDSYIMQEGEWYESISSIQLVLPIQATDDWKFKKDRICKNDGVLEAELEDMDLRVIYNIHLESDLSWMFYVQQSDVLKES